LGRAKFASGIAEVTDALALQVTILGKRVRHLVYFPSIAAVHIRQERHSCELVLKAALRLSRPTSD
jgi:hypothetical protein